METFACVHYRCLWKRRLKGLQKGTKVLSFILEKKENGVGEMNEENPTILHMNIY